LVVRRILLRIHRRSTSWEPENVQHVFDVEFCTNHEPELHLSVYEIEDQRTVIVRTCAEHHASRLDPPVRPRNHLDVSGLSTGDPIATPGDSRFAFTREAHREIRFADRAALWRFVEQLLLDVPDRVRSVTTADARAYIKSCVEAQDPEWLALCQSKPKWFEECRKLGASS
jgi:hypothetical protein